MISRPIAMLVLLSMSAAAACQPAVTPAADTETKALRELQTTVHGRALRQPNGFERQWPGTYFETAFAGRSAVFKIGAGDVTAHILVDGKLVRTLVKPAPGAYRIDGLAAGRHRLRVEIANESQDAPSVFGGFYGARNVTPLRVVSPARQIEFIGDSYTVGYGNTSSTRDCSEDDVWKTTDTSGAFGPLVAKRYRADYQVNAISGRGIVRNYGGFQADTLPQAHPYALLNHRTPYADRAWRPQLIVISLGTNDFSTPLNAGEKWQTRDQLRADYENSYLRFVQQLRARNARASFILWATDTADGEVASETKRVVEKLRASGEKRVAFLLVPNLAFAGCHYHPSLADDRVIADRLIKAIEAQAPFGR
jgi:lysophospholipase L1-like esterase